MVKEIHVREEAGMKGYRCLEQADTSADMPCRERTRRYMYKSCSVWPNNS